MPRTVTVGLDGSAESRAAAEWAAREARLRGLPLKLVQVWEPVPEPLAEAPLLGAETHQHWSERIPREAAADIRRRHPGVEVTAEHLTGRSYEVLPRLAKEAELLVLGSRGLSGIGGFMVGSVGMMVLAQAERPVVLVRSGEQAADEHETDLAGNPSEATPFRPVVLGLDTASPDASVLEFACEAAAHRAASLRVVHGWGLPPYYAYGIPSDVADALTRQQADALTEVLRPWRAKFPEVEIVAESRSGKAAEVLVDAARDASLMVVGRRIRRSPFGAHIGPVTHAVLHHATAPVAVVAHY
ncbi:universal stress protein [Streptomyces sp. 15-116A]|uniref:universal stress protein n=1 Tax=Streptomyces sp. 15-116A TaxID=2259035 RepID=UPI0021B2F805|nr:universal stress protein [Streptomyces sp. 15-116A]MCT7353870.1 universal stress protein [Streptomyces sp. 15-116A]